MNSTKDEKQLFSQFLEVLRQYQYKRTDELAEKLKAFNLVEILKVEGLTEKEVGDLLIFEYGWSSKKYLLNNVNGIRSVVITLHNEPNLPSSTRNVVERLYESMKDLDLI